MGDVAKGLGVVMWGLGFRDTEFGLPRFGSRPTFGLGPTLALGIQLHVG